MAITILQLHKRASYTYSNIQDKAAYNQNNNTFALSDGTTQSFNSERWAALITQSFVAAPTFEPDKIISLFTDCVEQYSNDKFQFSPNPAIAALQKEKKAKGASATFLGVQMQGDKMNVISCGDTNLFIVDNNDELKCFPFNTIEALNANNKFVNTVQLTEHQTDLSFFQTTQLKISRNEIYIMATDALSRLFLKDTVIIKEILQIKDFYAFRDFCIKYWDDKLMEEDDVSAIIIQNDGKMVINNVIPTPKFEFPKEKEVEFTPISLVNNKENNLTYMQMQDIRNQFNSMTNELRIVKRKQNYILLFIIVATLIGLLNFISIASIYNDKNSENVDMQNELNETNTPIIEQANKVDEQQREAAVYKDSAIVERSLNTDAEKSDVKKNDTSVTKNQ